MRDKRSMKSRMAIGGLLLGALVTAIGAGCSETAPEAELDVEAAQLTPAEQEALVQRIAADDAYGDFIALAFAVQGDGSRKLSAMTPAQRAAAKAEALDLIADAKAPDANAQQLAVRMNALIGLSQAEITALDGRADAVRATFPNLVASGPALLGQAVQANPVLVGLLVETAGFEPDDPEEDTADCLHDCLEEYTAAHNDAGFEYALDMLECAVSGSPLAIIVCLAIETGEWAVEELIATNNYDNCKDECLGIPPQGECDCDGDCLSSEWCDTGTLGIGDNECEPDKAQGEVCSRDGKCQSGCCRYNFWQHPLSMTCDLATRC